MVFSRFLRSSSLRAPLHRLRLAVGCAASLRSFSSLAELPAPPGPKPRILSSIFAKPTPPSPSPRKPTPSATPPKALTLSSIFADPTPAQKPKSSTAPVKEKTKRQSRRPSGPRPRPRPRPRPVGERDPPKPPLPEAAILVRRLEEGGYLKGDTLLQGTAHQTLVAELDSRLFVLCAAEKFGQEHQEIAKWLSGSDLKRVALFGCPSVEGKTVFAAKRLRAFFRIEEDVTCRGCRLKTSCKFMNRKVEGQRKVILVDAMRVLTLLSLNPVPGHLLFPDYLKISVGRLLKEVVNLSS